MYNSKSYQTYVTIGGRQLQGTGARARLDFQLFNFSGHFRAAQTLAFDSVRLPPKKKIYWRIALSLFIA